MTAIVDHARHRLRLTETELAALAFVTGPDPRPSTADVEAAWATLTEVVECDEGRIPGWMAELGGVVAAPALHLVVELFTAEAPDVHQIWATPSRAAMGSRSDADRIELRPLETVMLPYELARIVALGPRPLPTADQPIVVPAPALEKAEAAAAEPDRCRQMLIAAGLTEVDAVGVAALSASRRMSWRVTSTWASSPTDVVSACLVVIDGGEAGLWISEAETGEEHDALLTLLPSRPSEVWQRLLLLLSKRDEP